MLVRKATFEACPPYFVSLEDGSLLSWLVMIVGPPGTPYQGGFFIFRFFFGATEKGGTYPFQPPKVTLLTTNDGLTRFNPNLYACGKVCLSILGTWGKLEWSPVMNVIHVIQSIQGMVMTEQPFYNEPGFEKGSKADHSSGVLDYSQKISHEVLRVAVLGNVEAVLNIVTQHRSANASDPSAAVSAPTIVAKSTKSSCSSTASSIVMPFANEILNLFQLWRGMYKTSPYVKNGCSARYEGRPFVNAPFEGTGNEAGGMFRYNQLLARIDAASNSFTNIILSPAALRPAPALALQSSVVVPNSKSSSDDAEIFSVQQTHSHRSVIRFGRLPQDYYLDVPLEVEVVYITLPGAESSSDTAQRSRPVVRVLHPLWHPQVAWEGGYVYWFAREASIADDEERYSITNVALMVQTVLCGTPNASECSWANLEAARECFAGSEQEKEKFRIHARQVAADVLLSRQALAGGDDSRTAKRRRVERSANDDS